MTDNAQLRNVLPSIPVGATVVAYDRKIKDVSWLCASVRRGTGKYFQCKTNPLGVVIRRVE